MTQIIDSLLSHTGDIALRRRAKWMLEKIEQTDPKFILDVGCGDGFYLHLLNSMLPDARIIGVDTDKNALKSASFNVQAKNVKLKSGDICNLKFRDNSFDVALASEVLEHVRDDTKGLKNIYRVLKQGGLVVISVPHCNYPVFWDPVNWVLQRISKTHVESGFLAGIWNQHLRLYSSEKLRSVLKKSGFSDIKIIKLTHFCLPFNHHIINLGARILAAKNIPSFFKKKISKFSSPYKKRQMGFNPFRIIFKFDILNDKWNGCGSAVSLVAIAKK